MGAPPPGWRRLAPLGAALGVCVAVGFTLGLLGGPQRRSSSPGACRPRSHVVFLKTHKTGGSSVLNVLSRYAESRRLRFALPVRYQFGYPGMFRAELVRGFRPGETFDVLGHHMRFRLREVQRVMPNDSFYFSIVRDPGSLGASAFSYFRTASPAFRRSPSLAAFLASPSRFFQPGARGNHYARDLQWFDFGLPRPSRPSQIPALLAELERIFPLVLLAERFDESLVLLRERLCWPPNSVDTFPHNSRGSSQEIPAWQVRRLRAWNSLDWALYSHFNRTFWRHAERFGLARLRREAAALRRRREELARRCLRGGGPVPARAIPDGNLRPFQPPGGGQILGFALREGLGEEERELCGRMAMPELPYKDLLERRQFGNGSRG
ncbi:PREDICTED: galactose-3-O-sulfotransferase 4 [Pseudopodoces humilis]|uniref:galactose-3-O-sulfotransferase 4 n=1 Tax=Pseudopodoces humilis TaxID=181119 RepID=UPI00039553E5|nr:PREDICTED: galactose-3-O-sulfotransferase 4 [Pseudopodoces humilis]